MSELHIDRKVKSTKGIKIIWTPKMIYMVKKYFPVKYNRVLAAELNVSMRSLIRKARELGIEKESNFLDIRREEITRMAMIAHPPNPHKGHIGWSVPNSQNTRFKVGNISIMTIDPAVVEKARTKRNELIKREKIRAKLGLSPISKIKLKEKL